MADVLPLTILAGLGHHQGGVNSVNFLNIDPLLRCAGRMRNEVRVLLLAREPEELRRQLPDVGPAIEIIPFVPQEEFFTLLSRIDIYFRVQNDASIPISVIEAMSLGCAPIVNERCLRTWAMPEDGRNLVAVKFGDPEDLERRLRGLVADPGMILSIGRSAARLAAAECDFEKNLKSAGLI